MRASGSRLFSDRRQNPCLASRTVPDWPPTRAVPLRLKHSGYFLVGGSKRHPLRARSQGLDRRGSILASVPDRGKDRSRRSGLEDQSMTAYVLVIVLAAGGHHQPFAVG
jgi:hypothetical protein